MKSKGEKFPSAILFFFFAFTKVEAESFQGGMKCGLHLAFYQMHWESIYK